MALSLRFDPSIEFHRLLARPQIDEDGVVYANAFDQNGTAFRGQIRACVDASVLKSSLRLDVADTRVRERGSAPSPEELPKAPTEKAEEAAAKMPNAGQVPQPPGPTAGM